MKRITEKQLKCACEALNQLTKSPLETYVKSKSGKYTAQIGNYHLSMAYGGVSLHRIMNNQGGVDDVFRCGYVPKHDCGFKHMTTNSKFIESTIEC